MCVVTHGYRSQTGGDNYLPNFVFLKSISCRGSARARACVRAPGAVFTVGTSASVVPSCGSAAPDVP